MDSAPLLFTVFIIIVGVGDCTDCPDDWTANQGSCYLFGHGTHVSFFEAEHYCRQHGGDLVHINDATEYAFLKRHLDYFQKDLYWIGLTDEFLDGEWRWTDTNETAEYTNWKPGEPNGHAYENCAQILYTGWNDAVCRGASSEPLCEIRHSDGSAVIGKKRHA